MSTIKTTQTATSQKTSANKATNTKIVKQAAQGYVFSWSWLAGGILFLLVISASAFGLRTFNVSRMGDQMIGIADALRDEGKVDIAIDVLNSYLQTDRANARVWSKQCELWSILHKEGMNKVAQLKKAIESQKDALAYMQRDDDETKEIRERVLEMQLSVAQDDPKEVVNVLSYARDILQRWPDNAKAKRALALGLISQLERAVSVPPDTKIDAVLRDALRVNPGDVELSVSYAGVIRQANSPVIQKYISGDLANKTDRMREDEAMKVIDDMVRQNPDNSNSYLSRYRFRELYKLIDQTVMEVDPDLVRAIELNPNAPLALQAAGQQSTRFSILARLRKDDAAAAEKRNIAIDYFSRALKIAPGFATCYVAMGDLYASDNQIDKAVEVWQNGVNVIQPQVNPELHARLASVYIERKEYDKAFLLSREMEQFVFGYGARIPNQRSVHNIRRMATLIHAQVFFAQRQDAVERRNNGLVKLEAAKANGLPEDLALRKIVSDSAKEADSYENAFKEKVRAFKNMTQENEFEINPGTALSRMEGEAFMNFGRVELEAKSWDTALDAFRDASRFPMFAERATLLIAEAYKQINQPAAALKILQEATAQLPGNPQLQVAYATLMFQQEMRKRDPKQRNYDAVERQLDVASKFSSNFAQPWALDIMKVQLTFFREGGTLQAQQKAMASLEALENDPQYSTNLTLLAELASQYSTMGAVHDFDRVVDRIKAIPGNGLDMFFQARIQDARRKGDLESLMIIIDEAISSVPDEIKDKYVLLKDAITNPGTVLDIAQEKKYENLISTYESPSEYMSPQSFFELANLAYAKRDFQTTKGVEDRLKVAEGPDGTRWRFLAARRLVDLANGVADSPYLNEARALHREILRHRPNWDMAYELGGMIEETAKNIPAAITAYSQAVGQGSTQLSVYRRLISLMYQQGQTEDAEEYRKIAESKFPGFSTTGNALPAPYQGYYEQIYQAISEGNISSAETYADECMRKANENNLASDRIIELNMKIGKLFMDSSNPEIAETFLASLAALGGEHVYPLAVCYAKMGRIDDAFELLNTELKKGTGDPALLRYVLVLFAQVKPKPGDAVMQKIDQQVLQMESEMLKARGTLIPLADYWIVRGRPDLAIPVYREGLRMYPNDLLMMNNLAMMLVENGENSKAPLSRSTFDANSPKRINLGKSRPTNSLILRFPGAQTAPKPEDFKFIQ